jgi:PAS domain S-box-containing protein
MLYDAVPGYITFVGTDYRILSYNKTVKEQFGKDLKGRFCYETYQGRDEICPDCAVKKAMETKKPAFTFQPATEVSKPVEIYAHPIFDEKGKVAAVVEHGMDVSEKMGMIEALSESEERFRNFFEGAPDAMLIADPETGIILDANPTAARMMQRPHEEIVGLHQSELHPRRMDEHSMSTFKEHAQEKKGLIPVENYLVRPDGTEVPIEVLAQEITLKGKTVLLGTFRDITKRKRAEGQLKLYSEALEEAADGFHIVDLEGRIIHANKASEDIFGFSAEEIKGKHVAELNVDPDVAEQEIIPTIKKFGKWAGELMVRHKDGSEFPVWLTTALVRDSEGMPIAMVGSNRDITERKRAEEAQQSYSKRLEIIREIGILANSTLDLEDVLHSILDGTLKVTGATVGMIFIKDAETGLLRWGASVGLSEAFVQDYSAKKIQPGEGLTGTIFETGEPIYIPTDSSRDARIARPVVEAEGLNTFIGVPIYAAGEIVGVMNILTRPPDILSEDHIVLISAVGAQVGSAISNAQLFKNLVMTKDQLNSSLNQKALLFREMNHRVNNNLMVISSLLNIQSSGQKDTETAKALLEARNRVRAVSLIHEMLYKSDDLRNMNVSTYINSLVLQVFRTHKPDPARIALGVKIPEIHLDIDTIIPLGLIVNELLSNAFKHAFPDGKGGEVGIRLAEEKGKGYSLTISDTGIGLPEGIDVHKTSSLGLQIVTSLTDQINGTLEVGRDKGTEFRIAFEEQEF